MVTTDRKIILEDGQVFYGKGFGAQREAVCELVFNTAMVGYQEVLSDPSYTHQAVVMTYPLIGNYGITDEDFETKIPTIGAFVVREYNDMPSNFRYTKTLSEIMEENQIPGISEVDTRMITRIIRSNGSCKAMITDAATPDAFAMERINSYKLPDDAVAKVSSKKNWYSRTPNHIYNVVAVDCGIKLNSVRKLNQKSCNVTVVPYNTKPEDIMALRPDGIFISNGPGNPMNVTSVVELIKTLKGRLPIFGICLGHQLIALACGAKTYKMKFGHRGGNHPVVHIKSGKIDITSQNHSYAVDMESVKNTCLTVTHKNLLDNTVEGLESKEDKLFSVQYHPESAPGPQDSAYLFDKFICMMSGEDR